MNPKRILLVDDSPNDRERALEALKEHKLVNEVITLRDGVEALDYLYRRGEFADRPEGNPAVILLDLKMPRVDGIEVLRQVKSDEKLKVIPIVVMTSSREDQDVIESYKLGVNAYVVKPLSFHEFIDAIKVLGAFLNHAQRSSATKLTASSRLANPTRLFIGRNPVGQNQHHKRCENKSGENHDRIELRQHGHGLTAERPVAAQ